MSTVSKLHSQAMEFTNRAQLARAAEDAEKAARLFELALSKELAAISEMPHQSGLAWDVLHRSAGTLALDCKNFRLAEQLASRALGGDPHPEIAAELRDVWERASFHRHLQVNELELGSSEVQLSLVGRSVANGMARLSDLMDRTDSFQKLIYRIVQRRLGQGYTSRIPKSISDDHRVFASTPRSGSFTITLKLAHTLEQPSFPGMLNTEEVVSEFMDLLELADSHDHDELRKRIPNDEYLWNFLGLAKRLAPDGNRIRQVGFTTEVHNEYRELSITTPASNFMSPRIESSPVLQGSVVEISGDLRLADARGSQRNRIVLLESDGSSHEVTVPYGMMDDIVRPMWNSTVTVTGRFRPKQRDIWLHSICEYDPDNNSPSISVYNPNEIQQQLL